MVSVYYQRKELHKETPLQWLCIPLIECLNGIANQVWYADDSAAGSTVANIRRWWDVLVEIGPLYGHYPNSSKTHILTKPEHVESVTNAFKDTDITVSTNGKGYLGGAIGSTPFVKLFMEKKLEGWVDEIKLLSKIANSQPHAAYAAFTHGLYSKWNYVLRVIDLECLSLSDLLQPLETAITSTLLPALTGQSPGDIVCKLLALPTHLGSLSLINPIEVSAEQHHMSKLISAPLVNQVIDQTQSLNDWHASQQRLKSIAHSKKKSKQKEDANNLYAQLPMDLQRCVELLQEKGASVWLTALPIENHGFALHKSAFRDALCLRYNWPLNNQPSQCNCGHSFRIDHALSCPTGGFPSEAIRHNEVRDITASLLSEVCHGVSIEPHLQPLTGETMALHSANVDNNSRLLVAFGVAALKEHSSMFGYSTLALDQTGKPPSNLCTDVMSRRKKGNMTKGSERLNTQLLHHWFYQLLAGWGEPLQPSTRDWLLC